MSARAHPPVKSARAAGLRYVSDDSPGFTRVRAGGGFIYRDARGRRVTRPATLARIRALAIPPAWRDVWICPSAHGHVQATGRDARGRKQYRYHARWSATRDEAKYGRLLEFGRALPAIRRRTRRDFLAPPLSRARVLATVLRLLEATLIRIGNEEYARDNGSFGLTTLKDKHVRVRGARMQFRFRAKSGVFQTVDLADVALARSVKRCQDLPGQTLFQYLDEAGRRASVGSADVNAYLRDITDQGFTAKDFSTWAGTVLALRALRALTCGDSVTVRKRQVVAAIDEVASKLGNTRAVCRKCYVHPAVLDAFLEGAVLPPANGSSRPRRGGARLTSEERAVLALLKQRLKARRPRPR